jgi:hypothetical protein
VAGDVGDRDAVVAGDRQSCDPEPFDPDGAPGLLVLVRRIHLRGIDSDRERTARDGDELQSRHWPGMTGRTTCEGCSASA